MLSYQHIYHAGNRADLLKHRCLARLLAKLTEKDRALSYMETHAGSGLYDLAAPEARKTAEAEGGIEAALRGAALPADDPFLQAVTATRAAHGATIYPGSPAIARYLLRTQDVLHLFELHPGEAERLRAGFRAPNVHVHHRDGYEGVLALSPPRPLRGLVLIDPSYEVKAEYRRAAEFMRTLYRKWPQACLMLWYPMLPARLHERMLAPLLAAGWPVQHHALRWSEPSASRGMYGCGVVVVNAPYGLKWAQPGRTRLPGSDP